MVVDWTFVSAHGAVLLAVRRNPDALREQIADDAGISLRWTIKVLGDLLDAGYLRSERSGRRNRYVVNEHRPVRHDVMRDIDLERVVQLLAPPLAPAEIADRLGQGRAELAQLVLEIEDAVERLELVRRRRDNLADTVQRATAILRREAWEEGPAT